MCVFRIFKMKQSKAKKNIHDSRIYKEKKKYKLKKNNKDIINSYSSVVIVFMFMSCVMTE